MASKKPRSRGNDKNHKRVTWFKSWAWTVLSFLAAVGIGLLLLTELRAGALLAILAGLGVYFLMAFLLPSTLVSRDIVSGQVYGDVTHQNDPRVDLLVEAHQHVATISAARNHVPLAIWETLDVLHRHAQAIIDGVSAQPEKLNPVLRFFTYYLPSTADLVMDRIKLAPHAGSARLLEIDQTLERLVEAFAGFETAVRAPDLASVDLDVELLDQALKADLPELKS